MMSCWTLEAITTRPGGWARTLGHSTRRCDGGDAGLALETRHQLELPPPDLTPASNWLLHEHEHVGSTGLSLCTKRENLVCVRHEPGWILRSPEAYGTAWPQTQAHSPETTHGPRRVSAAYRKPSVHSSPPSTCC